MRRTGVNFCRARPYGATLVGEIIRLLELFRALTEEARLALMIQIRAGLPPSVIALDLPAHQQAA